MTFSDLGSPSHPDKMVDVAHPPEDLLIEQAAEQAAPAHLSLTRWLSAGLRAGFFVSPRLQGAEPKPWQVLALVLLLCAVGIGLGRLQVPGPAVFDPQAWLSGWWTVLLFIALAWWALPTTAPRVASLATACLVWMLAELPAELAYQAYTLALAHELIKLPAAWMIWVYWVVFAAFLVWAIGVNIFVLLHFFGRTQKTAVFAVCLIAAMALTVSQFNARSWQEDYSKRSGDDIEKPRLHLTQQVFEEQQTLLKETMARVAPERKDRIDVYGLVFAPYAAEDVFLRESTMVSAVLRDRFDA
ncbi:MAG: hypothetical protein ABIO88_04610, partial [Burkholderiaceae bacterium]